MPHSLYKKQEDDWKNKLNGKIIINIPVKLLVILLIIFIIIIFLLICFSIQPPTYGYLWY